MISERVMATRANAEEEAVTFMEDEVSRLFDDGGKSDSEEELSESESEVAALVRREQLSSSRTMRRGEGTGGISGWVYDTPFKDFTVEVDDVDLYLQRRYMIEVSTVYRRVLRETRSVQCSDELQELQLSPLQCFRVFVSTSLLQKIADTVNRVLLNRGLRTTDVYELEGVIIMHSLCAAYGEPVKTITSDPASFLSFPVNARRYHEVWSSMSCTLGKRQRVEFNEHDEWSFLSSESNAFVMQIESEVSSINRRLCYVPGSTILSLDDDLLRLSSRDVLALTALAQTNNPKKGLGVVNNALCSALTSLFLVAHHSRPGETLTDVWSHIVQLLQGVPTIGAVKEMPDAIFASDRGYNGTRIMQLINERLGATSLGTHKRTLDYPFVFGHGRISKRHKGRRVSEKGCRSSYSAIKKSKKGRDVEACLYREAYSGRIAAYYHNNVRLFGSSKFTLVPRQAFCRIVKYG